MVIGISKRGQLRNERALQDLIRTVPGNDRCADCQAMNPGWASWNLGVFLCMRCAALHRKLGTHISKVKSLSMDSWASDQVDNMKSHGNTIMNQIYNPKNVKPPVPTDIDESDSCMERYIRQKYQHRSLEDGKPKPPSRHDSGYNRSPEGSPPPLPPKTGKFFGIGLRSASSTSNLSRFSLSKPSSPRSNRHGSPPPIRETDPSSFEGKLATLKDMGFPDERRNTTILRGLGGNMEKTVESLTRLGEGTRPISRARTPGPISTTAAAPASPPRATTSYNPFDQLDSKPASAQPTGKSYNPFDAPNPPQPASAQPLETSFQNLQVTQPLFPHSTGGYPNRQNSLPQPLYQQSATPPATTAFSQNSFVTSPQSLNGGNNPFFQSTAQAQVNSTSPYASQFPNGPQANPSQPQMNSASPFASQFPAGAQNNPFFSQLSAQHTSMQQPSGQTLTPTSVSPFGPPRHSNTMPALSSTSPFGQPSPFDQPQPQPQPQPQSQLQPQPLQPQPTSQPSSSTLNPYNPFQSMTAPSSPQNPAFQNQFQPQVHQQPQPQQQQSYLQPNFQSTPQPLVPQATGRMDKGSILSLYSMPSPSPTIAQQQQHQQQQQQLSMPTSPAPGLTSSVTSTPQTQPGSNVTSPQSGLPQPPHSAGILPTGTRNPFMMNSPPVSATQSEFSPQQMQPQHTQMPFQQQFQPQVQQPQQQQQSGLGIGMGMKTTAGPPPTASSPFGRNHMSQQSVDISGLHNGRHSPDAFASLSARYG